jgi:hypothetical protein
MYNRYLHNDAGIYAPIPEEPPSPPDTSPSSLKDAFGAGTFRKLFDQLHLNSLDSGDLLLLGLLFFLYREQADEELLVALGLLLIL